MKNLIVSHNEINGIPSGRHKIGNVVVYSGLSDHGISTPVATMDQIVETENEIGEIDTVYVYVGVVFARNAVELIRNLVKQKKRVCMIACDCFGAEKKVLACRLSVQLVACECGGRDTCTQLISELSGAIALPETQ